MVNLEAINPLTVSALLIELRQHKDVERHMMCPHRHACVQRAHIYHRRKSACRTLHRLDNLLNNNNESRVRIAFAIAAVSSSAENAMEQVNQRNLDELHRRLMMDVKSDTDGITKGLEAAIGDLGVYTQEVLTNRGESTGHMETALSAACRLSKPLTVSQLLHLQAIPTLEVYRSLMTSREKGCRLMIASLLMMFSKPSVRLRVLWLACLYNEFEIVRLCLLNPYIDSNAVMELDFDRRLRETWSYSEAPLPIQYAASRGFEKIVEILEGYLDEDKHAANDSYVDYLLIAACHRHRSLAEHILRRRKASATQYARIYEIIGASEIIANNSAVGKTLWKKAISILESSGSFRSRLVNDILSLEPTMQDFRTHREIEEMRAKELRIQALSIIRKYFGQSYVFTHALIAREYSKTISVFALEYITSQDNMSAINLKKIENSLDQLKFFLFPDRDLVLQCLRWCIDFVGHLRLLLGVQPPCDADLDRLRALCDFTCRILLTVEILESSFDGRDDIVASELNHLLRRVVAVFQPLNEKCCLLDRLFDMRKNRPGTKNVLRILNDAGADLVVTDNAGNVVHDYAAKFRSDDVARTNLITNNSDLFLTMSRED